MKIRLVNFRCYEDQTFDLGDKGLSLISGPSGMGKSSIFIGIYFALYGIGKKVSTHGKKSCLVEFSINDMVITRTRVPNRLILQTEDGIYEDDCAQEIINEKFSDAFDVTGYIAQNAINSFIMMSPNDKRKFLEKFAFKDVDLIQLKENNKRYIGQKHTELTTTTAQLELAKKVLSELPIPESVPFPVKCKIIQRDIVIKNLHTRVKNTNILIKKNTAEKIRHETELNSTKILETHLFESKNTIANIRDQIRDIDLKLKNMKYDNSLIEEYERKLESLINRRKFTQLQNRLLADRTRLAEMREDETNQINNRKWEIDQILYKKHTKSEILQLSQELSAYLLDIKIIEGLETELSRITVDLVKLAEDKKQLEKMTIELDEKKSMLDKLKQSSTIRICPSCSTCLRIENDTLVVSDTTPLDINLDKNTLVQEIKNLSAKLTALAKNIQERENEYNRSVELTAKIEDITSQYESEISSSKIVKKELSDLLEYKSEQDTLEKERKLLDENKFSMSYQKAEKKLALLEKEVESIGNDNEYTEILETEEELQSLLRDHRNNKVSSLQLEDQKKIHEKYIDQKERELSQLVQDHTKNYKSHRNIQEIDRIISEIQEKIQNAETFRADSLNQLEKIDTWQKNQKDVENYAKWEQKVQDLTNDEKVARKKYASATHLKETILQAESIAMAKIAETINLHASVFLEAFFPTNPILVQLKPEKETKKGTIKQQIDVAIEYKGEECDLASLSGGECSRVILAYTLALSEMYNLPLILLDESTSSLDEEISEIVFETIKETFKDKNVLTIAHQVTTGLFDSVITLGGEKINNSVQKPKKKKR